MSEPTPLVHPSEAFPTHVFDALGLPPRVLDERIGGSVMVLAKDLPSGTRLLLTAGVARLPVDSGLPVELAVEVVPGQEGAALVALRIVCDDVAGRRRTPRSGRRGATTSRSWPAPPSARSSRRRRAGAQSSTTCARQTAPSSGTSARCGC
ncbi:hypothetical protein [Litorihabitans aurantiacus]|uniref:Uncharacterized protein n=1 Tax=Litorihabitans aurantiacus TaxID=1930061 RepID=A0AA37UTM2_9MICO|nr:hypothetical protein [Litorihabitans aurantiacus]GMA30282.1 hypothetical protein GCM10025875_02740 [Litorihabitans aurantiacus]